MTNSATSPLKAPVPGEDARLVAWLAIRRAVQPESHGAQGELGAMADAAQLKPLDRSLAFEIVQGVWRNRRLLDTALQALEGFDFQKMEANMQDLLRVGAFQHFLLDRVPPHALVSQTVEIAKRRLEGKATGFANAALHQMLRQFPPDSGSFSKMAASLKPEGRFSWPGWVARCIKRTVGSEHYETALEQLNQPLPIYGRVNRLKVRSAEAVVEMLSDTGLRAREMPAFGTDIIEIEAPAHLIARNPCFLSGGFAIQDISARIVAKFTGARPNMTVVDYCAAPGGKTMCLAADMQIKGRLIGCDSNAARMERLEENILRLGAGDFVEMLALENARITIEEWVGPDGADRVLVDAPCSGLGTLRRHPEIRWRLSGEDLRRLPTLQLEILEKAAELVAPGGCLVYATCSFAREENEDVVEAFLARHAGKYSIVPAREGNPPDSVYPGELRTDGWLRFLPHSSPCDSASAVRIRRLRR